MLACPYILAVKACECLTELLDKLLLAAVVDEKVVGGNAGLSCIECLSPCNASCRNLYVGIGIDDTGARPLIGIIRKELRHPLSKLIIGGQVKEGDTVEVSIIDDKIEFTVKK